MSIMWAAIVVLLLASAPGVAGGQDLPSGTVVDRVVVEKAARRLSVFRGTALLKTYRVSLGQNPKGHKQREGDGRTP